MLQKTRGIILHNIKYSDTGIIVHIYTEKSGRRVFLVKGARRKKSSLKVNLFQPLHVLNFEIYFNPKREVQLIKEYSNVVPFISIPYDIRKSSVAIFMGEMLYRFLQEEEGDKKLFDFLLNSIYWLDRTENSISNFHLFFLIHLTKYLGFYPNENHSPETPVLDLKNGSFLRVTPNHRHYLDQRTGKIFNNLQKAGLDEINLLKIDSDSRTKLLNKLIEFYKLHQPYNGEINSCQILKEVFH